MTDSINPPERQQTTLTPRQKAAAEAVCRVRFTAEGDGCECATASECGCEEIALAALAAADAVKDQTCPSK